MKKYIKNFVRTYILKTYGTTRIVFVFDKFVIKIPNFCCSMNNFLLGCYCNWSERILSKTKNFINDKNESFDINEKVAKSYFCTWFGIILIQEKINILSENVFEAKKFNIIENYSDVCSDIKAKNFGFVKRNNSWYLVTNDYGQNL